MEKKLNIATELSAVIVNVINDEPQIILAEGPSLPSGPLEPHHKKLEQGLRAWVDSLTGLHLGYVEQLYTFADKDRDDDGERVISIGYLALTQDEADTKAKVKTMNWYQFFPWEDHRNGMPTEMIANIRNHLSVWAKETTTLEGKQDLTTRINTTFPKDARKWNEELVLQRYELLWEAGLIEEATRARGTETNNVIPGLSMTHDHRRILATAIARLRAKIKYRPVVFELMPPQFTLLQLQQTVEALAGLHLHKQNFRRLVQGQGLVEETKGRALPAKGRPAKLFTFRHAVKHERAVVGAKLPRR